MSSKNNNGNLANSVAVPLISTIILVGIMVLSFTTRLFSVLRFESVIHEFDPWFNYRATIKIVQDSFYDFLNWFDPLSWYPLGRVVGGTAYPGLMWTSGVIYNILHSLNIPVDIRNVCVLFAPLFSCLTSLSTYLITKECKDSSAGLFAALFISVAPGYISRSVAGSYDNEGIAIFLLVITFYFWIKAVKNGSPTYSLLSALSYFYMTSSWGGYVYIINLIPLHVLTLLIMGRYSNKLYTAYSTFYVIGLISSMQVPFIGFLPVKTNDHMASLGIFFIVQLVGLMQFIKQSLTKKNFQKFSITFIVLVFSGSLAMLILLTSLGYISPWTGRFYSLWDTEYAKKHIPIIASVSEHQPTSWGSMFFDLHYLMILFPCGIFLLFDKLYNEHVFLILYGITSAYFAGVMVRLVLTLTPIVCIVSGIALSKLLDSYTSFRKTDGISNRCLMSVVSKVFINISFIAISLTFLLHSTWVTSNSYSSPSIVLAGTSSNGEQFIIDDFREAYYWLRQNTKEDAKVLSWWDYGYQITGMANRTTIVDNNTWNNTHIATVGLVMGSDEFTAYEALQKLDVDYVLIIFGGLIGYSGDDINKFLWMIRIGQGVYPEHLSEESFFTNSGEFRVDDQAPRTFKESVMYKLSYYRFKEIYGGGAAHDRVRGSHITSKEIELSTMDEAFTSENWIVRIYKVKPRDDLGRNLGSARKFEKNKFKLPKMPKYPAH